MREINSAPKTHSFSGRAVNLQTRWQLADVPRERRITGIVGFDNLFKVEVLKDSYRDSYLWIASLIIWPVEAETDTESNDSDDRALGIQTKSVLSIDYYEPRFVTGELTIALPAQQFSSLWRQLSVGNIAVSLSGDVPGLDHSFPASDSYPYFRLGDEKRASLRVANLMIQVIQCAAVPSYWIEERVAKSVADSLAFEPFGASYTQLAPDWARSTNWAMSTQVIGEFACSVAISEIDNALRDSLVRRIHGLLCEARVAFRKETLDLPRNGWGLPPGEFEKAISDRDEIRISVLKDQYITLWKHFSINEVVARGEAKYGAAIDGFDPKPDQLEKVAAILLMDRRMYAPTLEWALLNALVYAHCIKFPKSSGRGPLRRLLGINLSGDFKGTQTWQFILKTFLYESLKIGLTYFIVRVLAFENEQTARIITAAVTIARWLYPAVRWSGKEQGILPNFFSIIGSRQLEVFSKMVTAHEMLRTSHFNARALRDHLYRLVNEGVVFSPWVYHLLDARIRRES